LMAAVYNLKGVGGLHGWQCVAVSSINRTEYLADSKQGYSLSTV
jgi:hypothetical protein